jgi:hypothetical protein
MRGNLMNGVNLPDERNDRRHKPTISDELLAQHLGAVVNLNDTMGQLHVGLKTLRGVQLLGAEPRALALNSAGYAASQGISRSAGRLAGFSFREVTGAAAVIRLRDGADRDLAANGDLLVTVSLIGNESDRDWFMPGGISFGYGVYVEIVSGTVEGTIYLGTTL